MTPDGNDCAAVAREVEGVAKEKWGVCEVETVELEASCGGNPSIGKGRDWKFGSNQACGLAFGQDRASRGSHSTMVEMVLGGESGGAGLDPTFVASRPNVLRKSALGPDATIR